MHYFKLNRVKLMKVQTSKSQSKSRNFKLKYGLSTTTNFNLQKSIEIATHDLSRLFHGPAIAEKAYFPSRVTAYNPANRTTSSTIVLVEVLVLVA